MIADDKTNHRFAIRFKVLCETIKKSGNDITISDLFCIFVYKLLTVRILCYANRADINTCRYGRDYRYQYCCHSETSFRKSLLSAMIKMTDREWL